MAKVSVARRETEFTITLSEDEVLYLYDALRFTNPTDDHADVIGGDTVFYALSDTLEDEGFDLSFDKGTYAQEF